MYRHHATDNDETEPAMTVKWGVLSTAKIGREKVIPGIQAAPNCEVIAIAGRDLARTNEVADQLGIPTRYGAYQQLLDDPTVDAVYIPLPNHLHMEWTIKAAEAGKHVMCEKPLALTAADGQCMVDACAEAGVVFMEAFMYRLHPTWQAALDLVRSGRIGDLTSVQSWFSYFNNDPTNIRNIAEYGGGALMDIGCYSINLSRLLFDSEPVAVAGSLTRDPVTGVDITTSGVLEFPDGTATFTCSTRCAPDQRVHIYGTTGRITLETPFNIPPTEPTRLWLTTSTASGAPTTETIAFDPIDQYRIEAEQFTNAVTTGAPVPIPPSDGVANMAVIEQLRA